MSMAKEIPNAQKRYQYQSPSKTSRPQESDEDSENHDNDLHMLSSSAPHSRSKFFTAEDIKKTRSKVQAPFIIGVCGGSASGKTTVCDMIDKRLGTQRVVIVSLDSYYRALTHDQIELAHAAEFNFDHPDAFDWELLYEQLDQLRKGKSVNIPVYDFASHSRLKEKHTTIHGSVIDVILFEGILSFHSTAVRDLFDMKIFVDTDSDTRLARRVLRDIRERGRSLESVLSQYEKFVKPAFDQYIWTTKKHADVVIPRGSSNVVAIDLIVQHIQHQLDKRSKVQ